MFSHSTCTGGNWGNSKWKGGRSDWHSWSVPNVGFSRRFSSHWQLSSGGQWSDPQTLEIPRMPAVETQGLVWPVDYCLSGSMTTSAFTLRVDTVSWAAMISYQCMCGSFCPHWRIFWKILAAPTSHCPTWGEKSKVFPPKLPFLPPPPLLLRAVWTADCHCFSLTEGREQREGACYLTPKATTVWLTMWPIMRGRARTGRGQRQDCQRALYVLPDFSEEK